MNIRNISLLLFILSPALNGCLDSEEYDFDKLDGIKINPTYALPLAQGSLGLDDLINPKDSATLAVRDDQVLYFQYRKKFSSNSINEMLALSNVGVTEELVLPNDVTVPANSSSKIFDLDRALILTAGDQELRTILYKTGELVHEMSSSMNIELKVSIVFPTLTNGGSALTAAFSLHSGLPASGASTLEGFEADLTTSSPAYNTLPFALTVTAVNNTDADVTIYQGERISAAISLIDQEYELATGFFGNIAHNFPNLKLPVGPYNDVLKYDAHLAEMDLQMIVTNGYGVPLTISFPVFEAVNEAGETLNIEIDSEGGLLIASPESPGMEASTPFGIVNEVDVANFNPIEIRYDVRAHMNNGLSGADNFASDDSRLSFNLTANIPLIGSFKEIVIEDTLEMDFQDDLADTDIKRLTLNAQLINEFPFGGKFQIYTLDANEIVTDSLLMDGQADIITASTVTADGDLSAPGEFDEQINVDSDKFNKLINASHLLIKARLGTVQENGTYPDVKFKSNYIITVNLGVLAEFETTIEP